MIAFTVELNGTPLCTAGIGDAGVLTTILTWVKRKTDQSEELTLEVGGLGYEPDGDVHLKWVNRQLTVGDELCVRVIEADEVDVPKVRYQDDPALVAREKRRYYERLKREYGE
jgi:hypothetical protein